MRVFVTGATGVLGRRVVSQLVTARHVVTGNARSAEKAALLRQLGARCVHVDLFDPAALRSALVGHDVVINLATSIPPLEKCLARSAWQTNDRLRTDGSAALVAAALDSRVQRFIQESITFSYADGGNEWIDEQHPRAPTSVMESAAAAEARATSFSTGGGKGIVLRFAMLCAPEGSHADGLRRYLKWRVAPLLGKPDGYVSWIHADDAASAVVSALSAPSGVYNISEDAPLRRRELLSAVATLEGRRPPIHLPAHLLALGGDTIRALMRSQRVSNWKFKRATGWTPRYRCAVQGWGVTQLTSERPEVADSGFRHVTGNVTREREVVQRMGRGE